MTGVRNIVLRTLTTYLVGLVVSVLFFLVILPITFLPPSWRYQGRFFYRLTSWWSGLCLWIAGLSVSVVDAHNLPAAPAVIVMNHGSALDIFLAEKLLSDAPRMWLSKDEYKKTPLLNWILHRMHVTVDASSPTKAAQSLKTLHKKAADHGAHVLLFPEGGRFSDGKIHRFFKGFSLLSSLLKRSVVPVYIQNAAQAFSKENLLVRHAVPLTLVVGTPMVRRVGESHDDFAIRVRRWFVAQAEDTVQVLGRDVL